MIYCGNCKKPMRPLATVGSHYYACDNCKIEVYEVSDW